MTNFPDINQVNGVILPIWFSTLSFIYFVVVLLDLFSFGSYSPVERQRGGVSFFLFLIFFSISSGRASCCHCQLGAHHVLTPPTFCQSGTITGN